MMESKDCKMESGLLDKYRWMWMKKEYRMEFEKECFCFEKGCFHAFVLKRDDIRPPL
jgi:hypothetical protein